MAEYASSRTLYFTWGILTKVVLQFFFYILILVTVSPKNVKILLSFSNFVKYDLTPEQNYVAWYIFYYSNEITRKY